MVYSMDANYGGTEICQALKKAIKSRDEGLPTACFLLTDGEVRVCCRSIDINLIDIPQAYDVDYTIETVTKYVGKAKSGAPLRIFTLGIGGTIYSAMCEGIARAGNGVCLMAITSESIVAKCSKLVRASRTYILKNITVDWCVPEGNRRLFDNRPKISLLCTLATALSSLHSFDPQISRKNGLNNLTRRRGLY